MILSCLIIAVPFIAFALAVLNLRRENRKAGSRPLRKRVPGLARDGRPLDEWERLVWGQIVTGYGPAPKVQGRRR